jgi:hypothetical protein
VQRLYQSGSVMLQREVRVRINCRKGPRRSTFERLMRKYSLSRCTNGHGSANIAFFCPKQNRSLQPLFFFFKSLSYQPFWTFSAVKSLHCLYDNRFTQNTLPLTVTPSCLRLFTTCAARGISSRKAPSPQTL